MKTLLSIAAFVLPCALFAQTGYTITGKIGKPKEPVKAYLSYTGPDGKQVSDSSEIKKGKFEFKGTVSEPKQAAIIVRKPEDKKFTWTSDYISFFLENANMTFTAADSVKKAVINGSKINDDNREFSALMNYSQTEIKALQKKWTGKKSQGATDTAYQNAARKMQMLMDLDMKTAKDYIATHTDTYIGLVNFDRYWLYYNFDATEAEAMLDKFPESLRATSVGKEAMRKIGLAKKSQVGAEIKDFTQPDVNGNPVKLSDFRGKYVFVDFWASWCGPCRAENPHVKEAYNKLKGDKFEIIGISLDETKKPWVNAIEKDGLPWVQVSDLKGWKNDVAREYGISAIPQNMLIDPQGKVIAKNLRGEDLYAEIARLINK